MTQEDQVAPVDGATLLVTGVLGVLLLVYLLHVSTRGLGGPASAADLLAVLRQGARDPRRAQELREQALREAAEEDLHADDEDDGLGEDNLLGNDDEVDDDDDDDDVEVDDADLNDRGAAGPEEPDFENMSEKQMQKALRKRRKREEKLARQEWLRERERRRQAEREAYLARQKERDEERELEQAAQREALEEKLKEDEALYKRWRGAISIEARGQDADEANDETASALINYVKLHKVVRLEEMAADLGLRTLDAKERLESLESQGRLAGVFDDRGKFVHVTQDELDAIASYIRKRGRVSIRDLAQAQLVATSAAQAS